MASTKTHKQTKMTRRQTKKMPPKEKITRHFHKDKHENPQYNCLVHGSAVQRSAVQCSGIDNCVQVEVIHGLSDNTVITIKPSSYCAPRYTFRLVRSTSALIFAASGLELSVMPRFLASAASRFAFEVPTDLANRLSLLPLAASFFVLPVPGSVDGRENNLKYIRTDIAKQPLLWNFVRTHTTTL